METPSANQNLPGFANPIRLLIWGTGQAPVSQIA